MNKNITKIDYIKDMVYSDKMIAPKRIAEGTHKKLHYYVLTMGTHPCAYIDVSETRLAGISYEHLSYIDCHGGLTYSSNELATVDKKGWFIGWDYAHYNDYVGFLQEFLDDAALQPYAPKKWTTAEIVNECETVIEQICDLSKETGNFLQRLCHKLTNHKFRKCYAWSEGIEPTEFHYKCLICGKKFWNYTPCKKYKEEGKIYEK